MDAKKLRELGDRLLSKRGTLLSLWQEIADNFYPERADFTLRRVVGTEFAQDLTTSYPLLARRDLGNSLGVMLRPTAKEWFHMAVVNDDIDDIDARRWLEWATNTQRRAMYDRSSQFLRATKEGDHDFAAFGQCVMSVELNREASGLLYRTWHLRDVAWQEDDEGKVSAVFRKWKPTAYDLLSMFKGKNHPSVQEESDKDPFQEIDCMHIVVKSDMYDGNEGKGKNYVSIYYDVSHDHPIEIIGVFNPIYIVPRWQTVSGSQYAYSPATVAALPDARLVQAMTYTLLEAGEKFTNPPMLAVQDAIRSDISVYAGGVTWVDKEYDERLGEVLRPLTQDKGGMPLGIEMQRDAKRMISEAFYLNKLALPPSEREMTAFEIGQRIQEYIRQALPIFEPMEIEYNGAICEATFDLMLRAGGFGAPERMPEILRGAEIQFRFESPLHDMVERQKGQQLLEAKSLLANIVDVDPRAANVVDWTGGFRDALKGIRVSANWLRTPDEEQAIAEQQAQAQQTQQLLANMQQGANVAKTLSDAKAAQI